MKLLKYSWLILALSSLSLVACQSDSDKKASVRGRFANAANGNNVNGKLDPRSNQQQSEPFRDVLPEERPASERFRDFSPCHMDIESNEFKFCEAVKAKIGNDGAVISTKHSYDQVDSAWLFQEEQKSEESDRITWTYEGQENHSKDDTHILAFYVEGQEGSITSLDTMGIKLSKIEFKRDSSDLEEKISQLELGTHKNLIVILAIDDIDLPPSAQFRRMLLAQVPDNQDSKTNINFNIVNSKDEAQDYLNKKLEQNEFFTLYLVYDASTGDMLTSKQMDGVQVKIDDVLVDDKDIAKERKRNHNRLRVTLLNPGLVKRSNYKIEISYPTRESSGN